jgi:hypothetical protein
MLVDQRDSLRRKWSGREDSNFRPQRPERCALNQTALRPEFVAYCNAQRPERCALNQAALRPEDNTIYYMRNCRLEQTAILALRCQQSPLFSINLKSDSREAIRGNNK